MLLKIFEKKASNLLAENALLKFAVVAIVVSQFWLSYKANNALRYQRTVLVPANLDTRVIITSEYASVEYIKGFARTVTNMAFTYTSTGARSQFGELLQWYTPEGFLAAKGMLYSLADTIEATKTSSVFLLNNNIKVDVATNKMYVTGTQRIWVENAFIDTQAKTYVITYKIVDGRFFVVSLLEDISKQPESAAAVVNEPVKVVKNGESK